MVQPPGLQGAVGITRRRAGRSVHRKQRLPEVFAEIARCTSLEVRIAPHTASSTRIVHPRRLKRDEHFEAELVPFPPNEAGHAIVQYQGAWPLPIGSACVFRYTDEDHS